MLGGGCSTGFVCIGAFETSEEIIIHHGLVAKLDGVAFGGHAEVVGVADEIGDVV